MLCVLTKFIFTLYLAKTTFKGDKTVIGCVYISLGIGGFALLITNEKPLMDAKKCFVKKATTAATNIPGNIYFKHYFSFIYLVMGIF